MRFTLLFLSLLWGVLPLMGQSQFTFEPQANATKDVAYIHILYKTETLTLGKFRLRTTLTPDDPLRLAPNSYTLLKVAEDHVGFFSNYDEQTRPWIMDLEPGKHYFFRFTWLPLQVNIDELTQREFEMELFFNNIAVEPKHIYELGMPGS